MFFRAKTVTFLNLVVIFLPIVIQNPAGAGPDVPVPQWTHVSTAFGDLPLPTSSEQQTASLILDIDRDGVNDFVIGTRRGPGASLVWYRRDAGGWQRYLIEAEALRVEAGGAFHDIDGDGDADVVMGGDSGSNEVWWWENPFPSYAPNRGWTRHTIKASGSSKHHDQIFGDFDGDGQVELVFWNQGANALFLAEIPADPRRAVSWPLTPIYQWSGQEHEGLARADVDGDGLEDIVGGGGWFKYAGGSFERRVIDDEQRFTRAATGQLIPGGRPEIVFVVGDGVGRLRFYEYRDDGWLGRDLLPDPVDHGHSLQVEDINQDGHLDIFSAEMRLNSNNPDAKLRILYGDGRGHFLKTEVASGFGNHESRLGDLDGDGDLDILGKPYNWETSRVDIWLNQGVPAAVVDQWCRHVVDGDRPGRALFVTTADVDGDGRQDILSGRVWYRNPGTAGGSWSRREIGEPLNNFAAAYDFDRDGDVDILGTAGENALDNAGFVWARNDGAGSFTLLDNVEAGSGDFLQGAVVADFTGAGGAQVALSWHAAGAGVQLLEVPADPAATRWPLRVASTTAQDEALSAGDIDRDGDADLLLGTRWLRNDAGTFTPQLITEPAGKPDRNRLADINRDGRLDAVVGFEAVSKPGKLVWYEQPPALDEPWTEHLVAELIGPMSLDVVDMDRDGDLDVIVGEHNVDDSSRARLLVFENADGRGQRWTEHLVHVGDEHHDGAYVADVDGDGDLDIVSIGWSHNRVLLYENGDPGCQ